MVCWSLKYCVIIIVEAPARTGAATEKSRGNFGRAKNWCQLVATFSRYLPVLTYTYQKRGRSRGDLSKTREISARSRHSKQPRNNETTIKQQRDLPPQPQLLRPAAFFISPSSQPLDKLIGWFLCLTLYCLTGWECIVHYFWNTWTLHLYLIIAWTQKIILDLLSLKLVTLCDPGLTMTYGVLLVS